MPYNDITILVIFKGKLIVNCISCETICRLNGLVYVYVQKLPYVHVSMSLTEL